MPLPIRCAAVATLTLLSVATAHGTAQTKPPVPGRPYQFWDVVEADGGARKVYFRNDATVPITITEVVIQVCENTRQLCGSYPSNLVVPVGKTVVAFRVERLDKKLGWNYSYSFRTKIESTSPPPGFIPPAAMIRGPDGSTSTIQIVSVDALVPAVEAVTTNGACGLFEPPDLPAGHKAFIMIFGTPTEPTARQVRVRFDANGAPYEFNDSRHEIGSTATDPHTTSISIDPVRQSVMLRNAGDGKPATWFRATGASVMTATTLGQPAEMAARILKECSAPR